MALGPLPDPVDELAKQALEAEAGFSQLSATEQRIKLLMNSGMDEQTARLMAAEVESMSKTGALVDPETQLRQAAERVDRQKRKVARSTRSQTGIPVEHQRPDVTTRKMTPEQAQDLDKRMAAKKARLSSPPPELEPRAGGQSWKEPPSTTKVKKPRKVTPPRPGAAGVLPNKTAKDMAELIHRTVQPGDPYYLKPSAGGAKTRWTVAEIAADLRSQSQKLAQPSGPSGIIRSSGAPYEPPRSVGAAANWPPPKGAQMRFPGMTEARWDTPQGPVGELGPGQPAQPRTAGTRATRGGAMPGQGLRAPLGEVAGRGAVQQRLPLMGASSMGGAGPIPMGGPRGAPTRTTGFDALGRPSPAPPQRAGVPSRGPMPTARGFAGALDHQSMRTGTPGTPPGGPGWLWGRTVRPQPLPPTAGPQGWGVKGHPPRGWHYPTHAWNPYRGASSATAAHRSVVPPGVTPLGERPRPSRISALQSGNLQRLTAPNTSGAGAGMRPPPPPRAGPAGFDPGGRWDTSGAWRNQQGQLGGVRPSGARPSHPNTGQAAFGGPAGPRPGTPPRTFSVGSAGAQTTGATNTARAAGRGAATGFRNAAAQTAGFQAMGGAGPNTTGTHSAQSAQATIGQKGAGGSWFGMLKGGEDSFRNPWKRFSALQTGNAAAGTKFAGARAFASVMTPMFTVGVMTSWMNKLAEEGSLTDQVVEGAQIGATIGASFGPWASAIGAGAGVSLNVITGGFLADTIQKMPIVGGLFFGGGDEADMTEFQQTALSAYTNAARAQGIDANIASDAADILVSLNEAASMGMRMATADDFALAGRMAGFTGYPWEPETSEPVYSAEAINSMVSNINQFLQPESMVVDMVTSIDFSHIKDDEIRGRLEMWQAGTAQQLVTGYAAAAAQPVTAAITTSAQMQGQSDRTQSDAYFEQLLAGSLG